MMALTELPGTATSADDGTKKLWANFDKFLARDFKDTKVLMLWNSDTASLMSKIKPLKTMEDLKGMKIRTPSAAQSAQLDALGATPIDMPVTAIYNNLDRGVIDATMIPMSAALDFKLIEVAKYFTIDAPLGRSPFLVAMNKDRYDETAGRSQEGDRRHHRAQPQPQGRRRPTTRRMTSRSTPRRRIARSSCSPAQERQRWIDAFKPMIKQRVEDGEKAGLPARGLVGAYNLLS